MPPRSTHGKLQRRISAFHRGTLLPCGRAVFCRSPARVSGAGTAQPRPLRTHHGINNGTSSGVISGRTAKLA
ncbi:hypothetical protein SKAU_G00362480 [Synaphobranchus kaupii]|uniref:Uncharacterized protein n=1 Tax=Synaphobranchus kaupii TaxID=118154 RepID=A0A9Q1EIK3_SYNKA|nr:hypothetical protein SKAU_G00362480 [Synaphobranchus kaupii]